jgi:hypothetical protein
MTATAAAAARFCMAGIVGAGLGLFYGLLRPARRKITWLPDLIFVIATFLGWIYVGFGICLGDLRPAYLGGMALGGILWECTAGRLLRPLFFGFWNGISQLLKWALRPGKIFLKFVGKIWKKLFAKWKKWVTIGWNIRRQHRHSAGGRPHGNKKKKTLPSGSSPHPSAGEGSDPGGDHFVHHRYGGAAGQH